MERLFFARQAALAVGLLSLTLCSSATGQDKKTDPPSSQQGSDLAERLARVTGAGKKTEKERDPEAYKKLQEEVERAIRRGGAWLKKQDLFFSAPILNFREDYSTLGILTLLHAGEIECDPALAARCLDYLQRRPLKTAYGTYATALTAMSLGDWDSPGTSQRILECAQWLVENQGTDKSRKVWGYGDEVPGVGQEKKPGFKSEDEGLPLKVVRRGLIAAPRGEWDNSNSQFAILGLHSATHAGIEIPRNIWERVEMHFRETQNTDGSWGYRKSSGYGSMTCSGLASLIIARHHLGQSKPADDLAVVKGLEWLAEHAVENSYPL